MSSLYEFYQEKEIRDLAVGYYKDLVYEKNVLPSDAYIQTIDKFTTAKNMPTIYNVVPLTSIKLPVPKKNEPINQEKYFGRTKHMIPVIFKADNCRLGELANIKITSFNQKNLFGIYHTNKMKAA